MAEASCRIRPDADAARADVGFYRWPEALAWLASLFHHRDWRGHDTALVERGFGFIL